MLSVSQHDVDAIRKTLFAEVGKANLEIEMLNVLIKELHKKIFSYERKLGINLPEQRDEPDKYSCGESEGREQL